MISIVLDTKHGQAAAVNASQTGAMVAAPLRYCFSYKLCQEFMESESFQIGDAVAIGEEGPATCKKWATRLRVDLRKYVFLYVCTVYVCICIFLQRYRET